MLVRKAYVFRLYPDKDQEALFVKTAGCCRAVYNAALEQRSTWWRHYRARTGKPLGYVSQAAELRACKEVFPWLRHAPHHCLQQSLRDLDQAFKRFFSGQNHYPRPRRKLAGDRFRFPDRKQFRFTGRAVFLPKAGWVRWVSHRDIAGTVKSITVRRDGDWWLASVLVEQEIIRPRHASNEAVGVDLGVTIPVALSTGEEIKLPRMEPNHLHRLKVLNQRLARKRRGSSNRRKAARKLACYQAHLARRRRDSLNKVTHDLTERYSLIALEDLKVANMTRSAKGTVDEPGKNVAAKSGLNRSMLDVSMAEFRRQIEYKALWRGAEIRFVAPHHNSQTCHACGHCHRDNRESQAMFRCTHCGHQDNADINAARNILDRALTTGGPPGIACEVNGTSRQQQDIKGAIP